MLQTRLRIAFRTIALCAAAALCVLFHETAAGAVSDGLRLGMEVIIPSLFPFLVCTNLMMQFGLTVRLAAWLGPLSAGLLGLPAEAGGVFILGLLGGYPSGAQQAAALFRQGRLTKQEAEHAAVVCNNSGPAFLMGVMGARLFGSVRTGVILYGIHILSAICLGLLLRPVNPRSGTAVPPRTAEVSFAAAFTQSVRHASVCCMTICMYVTVFSAAGAFMDLLAGRLLPPAVRALLRGMMELSAGAAALQAGALPRGISFCMASFFAGFGGLCVQAQSQAIVSDAGLQPQGATAKKLLQGAVSFILALAAVRLFPEHILFPDSVPAALFSGGVYQKLMLLICTILCLYFRKLWTGYFLPKRV